MLVHLSKTSPYVCDLNRGPIEPANRMASTPSKNALALLEQKESYSKQMRTPLKLLAHDEVPTDTTTHEIDASLQPVWYTEQTIVDEQPKEEQPSSLSVVESELPPQPSLMHKSLTFTLEPLNDSEKENQVQINPPSDDSFRALEQLLGLGSAATVRESPKTNHDTLSLTVVTPTDIINATTNSARASFAPTSALPTMATIESMDATMLPSFLAENTVMEDVEQPSIKEDSNTDDDTNFSFELNDFRNDSKDESIEMTPTPAPPPPPPAPEPTPKMRAPTCADVAFRALIKPRRGGRISQPIKVHSPLAHEKNRLSAPTSRLLRSSCRRVSTEATATVPEPTTTTDCLVNETPSSPRKVLVQVETLPEEEEESPADSSNSVTLNLTALNEAKATPTKSPMPQLLSREYTYNSPQPRVSRRRTRSMLNQSTRSEIEPEPVPSPTIASRSMLGILLTEDAKTTPRSSERRSVSLSSSSPARPSLQMVSIGEEEQVSISVPRTMEMGVQTTPSLDNAVRTRQMVTMEQQTTPQMLTKKMSIVVEQETTPIPMKAVIQLQRNVRFQLTPTTEARIAEKEREEEKLRGSKPDIVLPVYPVQAAVEKAPAKKKKTPAKSKKRSTASVSPMKTDGPRTRSRSQSATKEKPVEEAPVRKTKRTLSKAELNEDQRKKIETLTVAGLKERLTAHQAVIPRGAKKADLLALLLNIETTKTQVEAPAPAKRTRRQKK